MTLNFVRGDIALITRSSFSDASIPWSMERLWKLGHAGVVRSALWDERVLFSGMFYVMNGPNARYFRITFSLLAGRIQN